MIKSAFSPHPPRRSCHECVLVDEDESWPDETIYRPTGLPVKVGFRSLLLEGDIIVAINDIEPKDVESLQRALNLIHIGAHIRLNIFRQGKIVTSELVITERPLQPGDVPESSQSFSVSRDKKDDNTTAR